MDIEDVSEEEMVEAVRRLFWQSLADYGKPATAAHIIWNTSVDDLVVREQ